MLRVFVTATLAVLNALSMGAYLEVIWKLKAAQDAESFFKGSCLLVA